MKPHEQLISWRDVPVREATLVAEGQYSPDPAKSVRVGLFCGCEWVGECWMRPEELPLLAKAIGARVGEWDAMYATGWSIAWTTDDGPLRIWTPEREILLPPPPYTKVRAYVSGDWVRRGVAIDGTVVKEVEDCIAQVDPTYDGLMLFCETSWARALARTIGKALKIPVVIDEAMT